MTKHRIALLTLALLTLPAVAAPVSPEPVAESPEAVMAMSMELPHCRPLPNWICFPTPDPIRASDKCPSHVKACLDEWEERNRVDLAGPN